ncbi:MAG: hypothetical protein MK135_01625 [Polyangiaceae bacterium]|nr:hypothetical protein [Polyangiaceae bacterium]
MTEQLFDFELLTTAVANDGSKMMTSQTIKTAELSHPDNREDVQEWKPRHGVFNSLAVMALIFAVIGLTATLAVSRYNEVHASQTSSFLG